MGGQVVNLLAVRHPHTVRSVVTLDPAHGAHGAEVEQIPARLTAYEKHGVHEAADFVAGAFSAQAPPGLRTAHIRTVLGTPDHVIAQSYAGMYTAPRRLGIRACTARRTSCAARIRRSPSGPRPAEAATRERGTLHAPGSRVDHWSDSGHYLHEEHPRRTIGLIEEWAGRTTGH